MGHREKAVRGGNVDEKLIRRIAEGDNHAFEILYRESKAAVYGLALAVVRNVHTAEDVMQETYIRVYDAAPTYHPQGKPMAWIMTITRNLALMKLRKNAMADHVPVPDWHMAKAVSEPEQSIDRMVLETAIYSLNDEERQIIMLHDIAGMKHREIGDILKIPLPTVLSKYRRALSKLKKRLREGMWDEQ